MKRSDGISCYYTYNAKEYTCKNFDILTENSNEYKWVPSSNGEMPFCTVLSGGNIGIGRGYVGGEIVVGKIDTKQAAMFAPWGGVEHKLTSYDALVEKRSKCW